MVEGFDAWRSKGEANENSRQEGSWEEDEDCEAVK
jgi:hypothetical protein